MVSNKSGREKEAELILNANKSAAVGRLMLGEMKDWHEFLEPERLDLLSLPRRQLKSGKYDIQKRLKSQLTRFCENNFEGMKQAVLVRMYEDIKANRGLTLPLKEFENRFAPIKQSRLKRNPKHLTISISLWGLQFMFPEDILSKDIQHASYVFIDTKKILSEYKSESHTDLKKKHSDVGQLIRKISFASRAGLLACFNLVEAYLNGLAWEFLQTERAYGLSNRRRGWLDDSSSLTIRGKLEKYPRIISGTELFNDRDAEFCEFLNEIKPFRDSLVHPSPFDAPERFGGYNKLLKFYNIDHEVFQSTISLTSKLIVRIDRHINGQSASLPDWLLELNSVANRLSGEPSEP